MNSLVQQSPSPFDRIKRNRADGTEYWSARDLQPLMGYSEWRNLGPALNRAIQAASNTGMVLTSDFVRSRKLSANGLTPMDDFELSRQAAYLVAMNGDPNKPEVAAAQAYFAGRTRAAEVAQDELAGLSPELRMVLDTVKAVHRVQQEQARQATAIQQVEAKVASIEGDFGEFAALGYAKLNDFPTDRPALAKLGKMATALMRFDGKEPRRRQDATFGAINIYPVNYLDAAAEKLGWIA